MNIKSFIQRHPLKSYFILAYAVTWISIFIFLSFKGFQMARLQMPDAFLIFLLMLLGPSSSCLILQAVLYGLNGIHELGRRMAHWKVNFSWYAAALITIPLLVLGILLVLSAAISPVFKPNFNIIGLVIGLLAGGLEEIGWTGFATPRLLTKYNPLKSGLILGLLWSLWHLLADFSSNISTMGTGWLLWFLLFWILPLTAYRILMTLIYNKTQSILVAQLMHASYTGWLFTLSPTATFHQNLLWQSIFAVSLWVLIGIVVLKSVKVRHQSASLL